MATVSPLRKRFACTSAPAFRASPLLAHESRDDLLSYSKKINKRPEDAGLRIFRLDVTMESILKSHKLIFEAGNAQRNCQLRGGCVLNERKPASLTYHLYVRLRNYSKPII